jgi:hypothetical protein
LKGFLRDFPFFLLPARVLHLGRARKPGHGFSARGSDRFSPARKRGSGAISSQNSPGSAKGSGAGPAESLKLKNMIAEDGETPFFFLRIFR